MSIESDRSRTCEPTSAMDGPLPNSSAVQSSTANSSCMSSKILRSLECDRVPDPYNRFKAAVRDRHDTAGVNESINGGGPVLNATEGVNGNGGHAASPGTGAAPCSSTSAARPLHLQLDSCDNTKSSSVSKSCE